MEELIVEDMWCSVQGDDVFVGQVVVSVVYDVDEQVCNLIGWWQIYDQFVVGCFVGMLIELLFDMMKLFCELISYLLCQVCEVCGDVYWFGILFVCDGLVCVDVCCIGFGVFVFWFGNVEFELVMFVQFLIYGVVVCGDVLCCYVEDVECCVFDEWLFMQCVMQVGDVWFVWLCVLFGCWFDGVVVMVGLLFDVQCDDLQVEVLVVLFDVCVQLVDDGSGGVLLMCCWFVDQVCDYVFVYCMCLVGVFELCEQLYVSWCMLQYCFQDVFGMVFVIYLCMLWLNGVWCDLCGCVVGLVQDVVEVWGFWYFSQFVIDYWCLFGKWLLEMLCDCV